MRRPSRSWSAESGLALLSVVMLTTVIGALGGVMLLLANIEMRLAENVIVAEEMGHAAAAAGEVVAAELQAQLDWDAVLGGAVGSWLDDGEVRPLVFGEALDLVGRTAILQRQTEARSDWGADTPRWRLFAHGPVSRLPLPEPGPARSYLVVWVADDPRDADGDPLADANGALLVHAEAFGPRRARRGIDLGVRRTVPGGGIRRNVRPPWF